MPAMGGYLGQISFYHECGHIEECVYHSTSYVPSKISCPSYLPPIDHTRIMVTDDDTLQTFMQEIHYQYGSCGFCSGHLGDLAPVGPIPDGRKRERQFSWRSIVNTFDQMVSLQIWQHRRRTSELTSRRTQLESELQSSAQMAHGEVADEIAEELEGIERTIAWWNRRKEWFENFCVQHFDEVLRDIPLTERVHLFMPGWDTDLFHVVDLHTIEDDEECYICLDDLGQDSKAVRELPCGHMYHLHCVNPWFKQKNSCPSCRQVYQIVMPPR